MNIIIKKDKKYLCTKANGINIYENLNTKKH